MSRKKRFRARDAQSCHPCFHSPGSAILSGRSGALCLAPKKARPSIGRKDPTGRTDACSGSAAATVSIGAGGSASGMGDKSPSWVRRLMGKPTSWQDKKATLLARNGS